MSASPLMPDQAKFILNWSLPTLKNEHQTTKRVIEAIPPDKGDYRPDSICKTALELAWHIVASEKRFFGAIAAGAFDFTPLPRPESIKNSAGIATWFDENFAINLERLEPLTGEQDDRLPRHVPAAGRLFPRTCAEPHHPPSRTAFHVPAAHGRQGAGNLRRKLRHYASPPGEGR
jgi:DinB family